MSREVQHPWLGDPWVDLLMEMVRDMQLQPVADRVNQQGIKAVRPELPFGAPISSRQSMVDARAKARDILLDEMLLGRGEGLPGATPEGQIPDEYKSLMRELLPKIYSTSQMQRMAASAMSRNRQDTWKYLEDIPENLSPLLEAHLNRLIEANRLGSGREEAQPPDEDQVWDKEQVLNARRSTAEERLNQAVNEPDPFGFDGGKRILGLQKAVITGEGGDVQEAWKSFPRDLTKSKARERMDLHDLTVKDKEGKIRFVLQEGKDGRKYWNLVKGTPVWNKVIGDISRELGVDVDPFGNIPSEVFRRINDHPLVVKGRKQLMDPAHYKASAIVDDLDKWLKKITAPGDVTLGRNYRSEFGPEGEGRKKIDQALDEIFKSTARKGKIGKKKYEVPEYVDLRSLTEVLKSSVEELSRKDPELADQIGKQIEDRVRSAFVSDLPEQLRSTSAIEEELTDALKKAKPDISPEEIKRAIGTWKSENADVLAHLTKSKEGIFSKQIEDALKSMTPQKNYRVNVPEYGGAVENMALMHEARKAYEQGQYSKAKLLYSAAWMTGMPDVDPKQLESMLRQVSSLDEDNNRFATQESIETGFDPMADNRDVVRSYDPKSASQTTVDAYGRAAVPDDVLAARAAGAAQTSDIVNSQWAKRASREGRQGLVRQTSELEKRMPNLIFQRAIEKLARQKANEGKLFGGAHSNRLENRPQWSGPQKGKPAVTEPLHGERRLSPLEMVQALLQRIQLEASGPEGEGRAYASETLKDIPLKVLEKSSKKKKGKVVRRPIDHGKSPELPSDLILPESVLMRLKKGMKGKTSTSKKAQNLLPARRK